MATEYRSGHAALAARALHIRRGETPLGQLVRLAALGALVPALFLIWRGTDLPFPGSFPLVASSRPGGQAVVVAPRLVTARPSARVPVRSTRGTLRTLPHAVAARPAHRALGPTGSARPEARPQLHPRQTRAPRAPLAVPQLPDPPATQPREGPAPVRISTPSVRPPLDAPKSPAPPRPPIDLTPPAPPLPAIPAPALPANPPEPQLPPAPSLPQLPSPPTQPSGSPSGGGPPPPALPSLP
jgi:hypothetical protein